MNPTPSHYFIHPRIQRARRLGQPIVALESTVITHGLPYPRNLELAMDMEAEVEAGGGVPATIAVLEGKISIGIEKSQLESLAKSGDARKITTRDLATAVTRGESGGTTVAATAYAAYATGILVFATGGIGGVHRDAPFDVSTDLQQLARTPLIVVCAGAKAILDLAATLEYLETHGVPVAGYKTDEFPAFYSVSSGLPVSLRLDTPQEIVRFAQVHWEIGMRSAVVVAQAPPEGAALEKPVMDAAIERALVDAAEGGVKGQAVSPYLLSRVAELTGSASVESNLALLRNNARLATEIAVEFSKKVRKPLGYV